MASVAQRTALLHWEEYALARRPAPAWHHMRMAVLVRPISVEDIESFWKALDDVARERSYLALLQAPPLEEVEQTVRANIDQQRGVHFVAVQSGEVIGWCDIHPGKQPGFTHAGRLGMGVRIDYRNQGIGRRLLTAALEGAAHRGLARIELEVFSTNLPAVHLYKKFGFVEEGVSLRARYVDGVWDDLVRMAFFISQTRPQHGASPEEPKEPFLRRIERDAGVPSLTETLLRLQPTDLQSLLLAVYRIAARRRKPSDVLAQYQKNRFVRPSKVPVSSLLRWESLAASNLPSGFETLELAPACPLGTSSVIAAVDQNWAVSTIRNIEVVSDPTNVMALECALRRRLLRSNVQKSSQSIHLAARHRVLRPQLYADRNAAAHFGLFGLCSAGRDAGNRQFELSALRTHCHFHLKLLRAFLGAERRIHVSLTDFGALDDQHRLQREFLAPLRDEFRNVVSVMNYERTSGRGYYRDLCCKIYVESDSEELVEVADGGSVDWLQKLLSDSKERLVISGIGSERVCDIFGR